MNKNTIDSPVSKLDVTTKMFDQQYQTQIAAGANEYELVKSFFKDVSGSENIASNFTTMLYKISSVTGFTVLQLLDDMKGKSKLQINGSMAYYLNSLKSKTTLYGVSVIPEVNFSVQRNIVI